MQALTVSQAARAQQVIALLSAKRVIEAAVAAEALLAEVPASADARHLLALCCSANGAVQKADSAFISALELMPKQPMFLENYAKFLRQYGRNLQAWEVRAKLAAIDASVKNLVALGYAAIEAKKAEQAIPAFQHACQRDSQHAAAYAGLGKAWQMLGDLDAANTALQSALSLQDSASNWSAFAYLQRISGQPEDAALSYQRALSLEPDRLDIKDGLSGALIDALDVRGAIQNAEAVVAQSPEYPPAQTTLSNLRLMYESDHEASLCASDFERAALAAPLNLDLQLAWIGFLIDTKQSARALAATKRSQSEFDTPMLTLCEANALEQLGETRLAAAQYAAADHHLGMHNVAFLNTYIRHLIKRGEWDIAAKKAELAIELEPDNQESWAYRATTWRLLDDPREFWLCDYERLAALMPLQLAASDGDLEALLQQVREDLDQLHLAQHEPAVQSVRGGVQTSGVLFGRNNVSIQKLAQIIKRTVDAWAIQLPDDLKHPFLRRKSKQLRFSGSWSVKLWASGVHANHIHNQGWMSSAFYVSLPTAVVASTSHAGSIQFGQPPVELGLALPPRKIIKPQVGYVALFPSYLWHGTIPFDDPSPRVTVAFDVVPLPPKLIAQ